MHIGYKLRMSLSSGQSPPPKCLGLSVVPRGACAVNPATSNLQGLGVCFLCACLWEKERACCLYRLTGLTFYCLYTEEKGQSVHIISPHAVYYCCLESIRHFQQHREFYKILRQVNDSRSIILYMITPKRGAESQWGSDEWMDGWMDLLTVAPCPSWMIHMFPQV